MSKFEMVDGQPRMTPDEAEKWKATHIVLFMIDGEAYYTDPVPEAVAHILSDNVGGIVQPIDVSDLLDQKQRGGDNDE